MLIYVFIAVARKFFFLNLTALHILQNHSCAWCFIQNQGGNEKLSSHHSKECHKATFRKSHSFFPGSQRTRAAAPLAPSYLSCFELCFCFLLLQISINVNLSNAALSSPPPQCSSIPHSSRTVGADAWRESNVVSSLDLQNQVVDEWGNCSVSFSAHNRKAVNLTLYWRCQCMTVKPYRHGSHKHSKKSSC